MTPSELRERTARIREERKSLEEHWLELIGSIDDFIPSDRQFNTWLIKYGPFDNVAAAIDKCACWINLCESRDETPCFGQIVKYCSGIMKKGADHEERA